MDDGEKQAKATIVAALIIARVVEVPNVRDDTAAPMDKATLRLRRLTDYIYDVITRTLPD
jgi:hypothetical protein